MKADTASIRDIFGGIGNNKELIIPFFQRGYVWKEEDWKRFLETMVDISTNNIKKECFFGAMITKQIPTTLTSMHGNIRSVIDGQQRLTTICLFFKALFGQQTNFKNLFFNSLGIPILSPGENDKEIFDTIINDKLSEQKNLIEKYKHNNILNAYLFFIENKDLLKKCNPDLILNSIKLVSIDLTEAEDEQQIFDTINSLGVRLTTAELLKNALYPGEALKDDYEQEWKQFFEPDENTRVFWDTYITTGRNKRNNLDVLLQAYLISLQETGDKTIKLNELFSEYKAYIKDNGVCTDKVKRIEFINNLGAYAKNYKEYIRPIIEESADITSYLQRLLTIIFNLDVTTVLPYVLYVLHKVDDTIEQEKIFKMLETYVIRKIVCPDTTKNFNKLFASLIRNNICSVESLKDVLNSSMPDDDSFKAGLTGIQKTNYIPKCLLYFIELSIRDEDKNATKIKYINSYELEHIMPQKWKEHWKLDATATDEDTERREQAIYTIGNMTLLTSKLNKSLHNENWDAKKTGKNNDGLLANANGLSTFGPNYMSLTKWNEETIESRTTFLVEEALKIWNI